MEQTKERKSRHDWDISTTMKKNHQIYGVQQPKRKPTSRNIIVKCNIKQKEKTLKAAQRKGTQM